MNLDKLIETLQIERECVSRDCNRDCGNCDLVQDRDFLLTVYDETIDALKHQPRIVQCKDCVHWDEWEGTAPRRGSCMAFHTLQNANFYCAEGKTIDDV